MQLQNVYIINFFPRKNIPDLLTSIGVTINIIDFDVSILDFVIIFIFLRIKILWKKWHEWK